MLPRTARRAGPAFSCARRVTRSGPFDASVRAMAATCAADFDSARTTSGIPIRSVRWVSTVAMSPSRSKGASLSSRIASSSVASPAFTRPRSRRSFFSSMRGWS